MKNLKPLIKLASQRSAAPIMNHIVVERGIATAWDKLLEYQISTASALPDGIYDAKKLGYALQYHETPTPTSDLSVDDAPCELNNAVTGVKFSTTAADIAAIAPAMSNDTDKYHLNGIHFEFDASGFSLLAATDGHRLYCTQDRDAPYMQGVTIDRKTIELIVAIGEGDIAIHVVELKAEITLKDYRIVTKLVDGTFPNWRRIIPDYTDAQTISENAPLLIARCKQAIALHKAEGKPNLALVILPFVGFSTGINAKYLMQAIGKTKGEVQIIADNDRQPVQIVGGVCKTCVIMPCRI